MLRNKITSFFISGTFLYVILMFFIGMFCSGQFAAGVVTGTLMPFLFFKVYWNQ